MSKVAQVARIAYLLYIEYETIHIFENSIYVFRNVGMIVLIKITISYQF